MKKVAFTTLGCKVNQYETDGIIELFQKREYEIVEFNEYADVYVVNTCTVTNIADKKSRQLLHKAKKMNRDAVVVAVGCYVQVAKDSLHEDDSIDLLIGNNNKSEVVNIVEAYMKNKEEENCDNQEEVESSKNHVIELSEQKEYEEFLVSTVKEKTRVFIKIQDGCNQYCSYCIIPYTRGRIRSRDSKNVITEVKEIVSNGYQEIVLTGIHLASYGKDLDNYHLIDLLEELDSINGLERIRLGSVEPNLITEVFIERLSQLKHICPHFHLSLQSGCDETLKRMNRKYNTKKYKEAVELLRSYYKNPSITTDIIVGFPMESDEEFNQTVAFVRDIKFADIHVFKYSIRQGTKAGDMSGQIDGTIKNERSKSLIKVKNELFEAYGKLFIEDKLEVLFETEQLIDNVKYIVGHTDNYLKVAIRKDDEYNDLEGVIKPVNILEYHGDMLIGKYY